LPERPDNFDEELDAQIIELEALGLGMLGQTREGKRSSPTLTE
jgi:hypothetical protein